MEYFVTILYKIKEQENTAILNQFTSIHHLLIGTTLAVSATLAISALVLRSAFATWNRNKKKIFLFSFKKNAISISTYQFHRGKAS